MARRRYPSDERRRRPNVSVHLAWQNHPTYAHVCADPTLRGVVLGLWMVARRAFAGRTNDTVTLTQGDVAWITGGRAELLRAACEQMGYDLTEAPLVSRVVIRNFSKKQGFYSADYVRSPGSHSQESYVLVSESESSSSPEGGAGGTNGKPKKSAPVKTSAPTALLPADRFALEAWATSKGFTVDQVTYAIERVFDWAASNRKLKADWVATIRNAMRDGWGLEGYGGNGGGRRKTFADQQQEDLGRWIRESQKQDSE